MLKETKDFTATDSGGDFDSAPKDVSPNSWINMENCRTLTTDSGEVGNIESIGSTLLINNPNLPAGTNIVIGNAVDQASLRVVYFVWNSNGNHVIYLFDTVNISVLLLSSQVIGGLNFDRNKLIHSARIVNGCIYWCEDQQNEPRRFNIDSALSGNLIFNGAFTVIGFNRIFTFIITPVPVGYSIKMTHSGPLGVFPENVPLDWSNYPAISQQQIIVNGITNYFTLSGITSGYALTILSNGNISLSIGLLFIWPSGDSAHLTTSVSLQFIQAGINAYSFPVSQSVISWIRRQPGLPPIATKIIQTSPVPANNFIALQALMFCYRYTYRGFELSTLSGQSLLSNYNIDGTTNQYNAINIALPLQEQIDQDVLRIDLVARYLNGDFYFIIKTWDKNISGDLNQIINHNNGSSALTFVFHNDTVGIALDSAYANKPFDSVPIFCSTIEFAKNRSFMGHYTIGYDTPTITSLMATPINGSSGTTTPVGEWHLIKYLSGTPPSISSFYLIYITNFSGYLGGNGYYKALTGTFPLPTTEAFTNIQFVGADAYSAAATLSGDPGVFLESDTDQGISITITGVPPPSVIGGQQVFKSDDSYQLAIEFLDNAGRKCGALTNTSLVVSTVDRDYSTIPYTSYIQWALNNANAANEIPVWAYYFSILITKSLRTRFFLQGKGANASYATKDAAGNYVFTQVAYTPTAAGCAFDISNIDAFQMGYSFTQGDIIKIYQPVAVGHLPLAILNIIAQVGKWVVTELQNISIVLDNTTQYIFEIYTPYIKSVSEPFYEVSQSFAIGNPGTNSRVYSAISGNIIGDIYVLNRNVSPNNYFTEAMSPNDKFWKLWFTNAGRPNFISSIGQVNKQDTIAFSNTYIQGSQSNGLSTYDALDTKDIYPECGPLRKLQLTSKVEGAQGSVMLGICEQETASMYLGESQLVAASGNANVAISNDVIGTINILKGSFGTINPESVTEFRGNVYWVNVGNGKVIQYSGNGLFPISSYKITRFWKLFCLQYSSMSSAQIEALGSRPFIFTSVDPHNWELLVTVPRVLAVPPKGYLPDYPNMIYPFDIYDGQAKTVVFKLTAQPNHWSGSYRHTPEGMFYIQNLVYGFKNGQLWQYNSISDFSITIFGVQYKARIMFLSNSNPKRPKVYNNISVESNMKPSLTYFRTEPTLAEFNQYDLYEQASDLVDFDYEVKEGQLYSFIYRNKLVPTQSGLSLNGLLTAEKIRALYLKILLEFTPNQSSPLELRYVNLGLSISSGHST